MERFIVLKNGILVIGLIIILLLAIKIFVIVLFKQKVGAEYPNRFLGWYSNMEIYGSGHPLKVKVLNAANALTTSFWIMLAILGSLIFVSKEVLN